MPKYLFEIGICAAFLTLCGVGGYARIWEKYQPRQEIRNAVVTGLEPYHSSNEFHWSSGGFRVRVEGETRPIDFPLGKWDKTVKEGDKVDMTVRRSFPWLGAEELDGLRIDDHK
jgi:hypothetical protein